MYVLAILEERRHGRRKRQPITSEAYRRQAARTQRTFERLTPTDTKPGVEDPRWRWGVIITTLCRLAMEPNSVTVHELALAYWISAKRATEKELRFPDLFVANSRAFCRALRERVDAGAELDEPDNVLTLWEPVALPRWDDLDTLIAGSE
jgi:hypothetical protein